MLNKLLKKMDAFIGRCFVARKIIRYSNIKKFIQTQILSIKDQIMKKFQGNFRSYFHHNLMRTVIVFCINKECGLHNLTFLTLFTSFMKNSCKQ